MAALLRSFSFSWSSTKDSSLCSSLCISVRGSVLVACLNPMHLWMHILCMANHGWLVLRWVPFKCDDAEEEDNWSTQRFLFEWYMVPAIFSPSISAPGFLRWLDFPVLPFALSCMVPYFVFQNIGLIKHGPCIAIAAFSLARMPSQQAISSSLSVFYYHDWYYYLHSLFWQQTISEHISDKALL